MRSRTLLAPLAAAACLAGSAAPAQASQMIAQNASHISLRVGKLGGTEVGLVTYVSGGRLYHTLVWGAINGSANHTTGAEPKFRVNYSGGYGTTWGANAWRHLQAQPNLCAQNVTTGRVVLAVIECKMPTTGQYWAVQTWKRLLPNMGQMPRSPVAVELHVSHWNTALPVLWLKWDWATGSGGLAAGPAYDHLFGAMSYLGKPVYGLLSTATGNPLDAYGRNVYVDIQNRLWHGDVQPDHWYRFNSFLTHKTRGDFCASVYPHNATLGPITQNQHVSSVAREYRATVMGPGVTPIVRWQGSGPRENTQYRAGFGSGSYLSPNVTPAITGWWGSQENIWRALDDEQIADAGGAGSPDKCSTVYGPR